MPVERETKQLVTPEDGHVLVLNTYITGGEAQQIQRIVQGGMQMQFDSEAGEVAAQGQFNPAATIDATNKAIELVVVSVNGSGDNVLDAVLDMRRGDFDFVRAAIDEVTEGVTDQKKAPSASSTSSSDGTAPAQ